MPAKPTHWRNTITAILAFLILIPSLYGFGGKFVEFVMLYRGSHEGAFAIAPIVNYLLASAGFFLMLLWATRNGMFRDIEGPKVAMLENEHRLDGETQPRRAQDSRSGPAYRLIK